MHSLLAPPPLPAQTYKYWPTAEADVRECLAADPYDACDFPQYCRDDAAQCRLWPDNRHVMAYPQPCPHLDGPDLRFQKNFSCWDHANYPGGLARGSSSVTSQSFSVAKAATMNEEAPLNGSAARTRPTGGWGSSRVCAGGEGITCSWAVATHNCVRTSWVDVAKRATS